MYILKNIERRFRSCFLGALAFFLLEDCVSAPANNIYQPMTARPVRRHVSPPFDGAIYHSNIDERPLFEDRRARNVGDILMINIVEKTTGNLKNSAGSTTDNIVNAATPNITTGLLETILKSISLNSNSSNKSSNTGSGSASEDLTGSISVTVVDVLENGYLLVSGEKQVAVNQSDEFIRFSGVVNPLSISNLNVVQSTQVSDAHIEFRNAGAMNEVINDARSLGFLGRFFKSVLPF